MKSIKIAILALFSVFLVANSDAANPLFRWNRVNAEIDSMVTGLEYGFIESAEPRTLARQIEQFRAACASVKDPQHTRLLKIRYHIFQARLLYRIQDNEKAAVHTNKAINLLQPGDDKYPEYWHSMILNCKLRQMPMTEEYKNIMQVTKHFENEQDSVMMAVSYQHLSNIYSTIRYYTRAIHYAEMAEQIYSRLGFEQARLKITDNIFRSYIMQGDSAKGRAYLRQLLDNPKSAKDKYYFSGTLLPNAYYLTHDPRHLERMRQIADSLHYKQGLVMAEVLLAQRAVEEKRWTDAQRHAAAADQIFGEVDVPDFRNTLYQTKSQLLYQTGQIDEAYSYLKRYQMLNDSLDKSRYMAEIMALENQEEILRLEEDNQRDSQMRNYWLLVTILLVISISGITTLLLLRMHTREKIRNTDYKMQVDKNLESLDMRVQTARHTSRLLENLLATFEKMKSDGTMPESEVKKVTTKIKSMLVGTAEWEEFQNIFGSRTSDLFTTLKHSFPSLTEADLRMCAYILAGKKPEQIASMLNIQPESVKKSHARIRTRLNLQTDTDLYEFLAAAGNAQTQLS